MPLTSHPLQSQLTSYERQPSSQQQTFPPYPKQQAINPSHNTSLAHTQSRTHMQRRKKKKHSSNVGKRRGAEAPPFPPSPDLTTSGQGPRARATSPAHPLGASPFGPRNHETTQPTIPLRTPRCQSPRLLCGSYSALAAPYWTRPPVSRASNTKHRALAHPRLALRAPTLHPPPPFDLLL